MNTTNREKVGNVYKKILNHYKNNSNSLDNKKLFDGVFELIKTLNFDESQSIKIFLKLKEETMRLRYIKENTKLKSIIWIISASVVFTQEKIEISFEEFLSQISGKKKPNLSDEQKMWSDLMNNNEGARIHERTLLGDYPEALSPEAIEDILGGYPEPAT